MLSLSVAEITSVSATFIIISSLSNKSLSNGLSVKVNGTPWPKCLARLADNQDTDQVMIIIYGLMPGRQYDVELGLIPGEEKLKGQIVTDTIVGTCTTNLRILLS
jgi:hypothetical protein